MDRHGGRETERAVLRAWGATIRRYRQWQQLSRRELAARARISPVFLGEIERGEKEPSARTLLLISEALGIALRELYLRVAMRLEGVESGVQDGQPALPLGISPSSSEVLEGVAPARDETAFELYEAARQLRGEQQVSLLVLARSLLPRTE